MSNRIQSVLLVACALAALPFVATRRSAGAETYPYQGAQNFHIDGTITLVDADRDRVNITGSDGHDYALDTDSTQIKLRDTSRPGDTGDLVTGMHIEVAGRLLSSNIIAADRLSVLPFNGPVDANPEPPRHPVEQRPVIVHNEPAARPVAGASDHIRLRGTVENVDDDTGVVVVRVNNHLRTIAVDRNTDLTDIHSPDDDHIGLHQGDRVTVAGSLRDDGTVRASAISLSKDIGAAEDSADSVPTTPEVDNPHQIVGRVSKMSDRLMTRDIKVRLDSDRDVTVHVPHDARVMRDGHPISVHELTDDDVVRVIGGPDGDDFKATRIDVLRQYQDEL